MAASYFQPVPDALFPVRAGTPPYGAGRIEASSASLGNGTSILLPNTRSLLPELSQA